MFVGMLKQSTSTAWKLALISDAIMKLKYKPLRNFIYQRSVPDSMNQKSLNVQSLMLPPCALTRSRLTNTTALSTSPAALPQPQFHFPLNISSFVKTKKKPKNSWTMWKHRSSATVFQMLRVKGERKNQFQFLSKKCFNFAPLFPEMYAQKRVKIYSAELIFLFFLCALRFASMQAYTCHPESSYYDLCTSKYFSICLSMILARRALLRWKCCNVRSKVLRDIHCSCLQNNSLFLPFFL